MSIIESFLILINTIISSLLSVFSNQNSTTETIAVVEEDTSADSTDIEDESDGE